MSNLELQEFAAKRVKELEKQGMEGQEARLQANIEGLKKFGEEVPEELPENLRILRSYNKHFKKFQETMETNEASAHAEVASRKELGLPVNEALEVQVKWFPENRKVIEELKNQGVDGKELEARARYNTLKNLDQPVHRDLQALIDRWDKEKP